MLKVYLDKNVFDAALERIHRVFSEFQNVVVGVSGGKDSTVVFNLALRVAREMNRLPMRVLFLDYEAEFTDTIEHIRYLSREPGVEMLWIQVPMKMRNGVSEEWIEIWKEGGPWLREKEPNSVKENVFGEEDERHMFPAILRYYYPNEPACYLSGMRAVESPIRYMTLTCSLKYKDITWGRRLNTKLQHYTFYPLYDWGHSDVWVALERNGWAYNKIYDKYYQYGVSLGQMRVSSVLHETARRSLFMLPELDPALYAALSQRYDWTDAVAKLGEEDYYVYDLPEAFSSWVEYRDYLLETIIEPEHRERFREKFAMQDARIAPAPESYQLILHRGQVNSLIARDLDFIKLNMLERRPPLFRYFSARTRKRIDLVNKMIKKPRLARRSV